MDLDKLKSIIESLLFLSGEPVKISKLAKIIEVSKEDVENALMLLTADYSSQKRGIAIIRKEGEVQMATNPDNAAFADKIIKSDLQEALSGSSLEILSIVAYRGPISRTEIEAIRGVNSTYALRNLLMRGLIERIDNPKDLRGYIYKISFEFLKKLGIDNINKLPDYESLSKDERINPAIND
ncbi:MAG: SMC-Scp complex subunit ScpB [bacterium]|nr:SMC-Scp complex subunit ScpB [bacterium]